MYTCLFVHVCRCLFTHTYGDLRLASGIVLKWTPLGDSEQFLSSASPASQLGIYGMSLSRAMIMSARDLLYAPLKGYDYVSLCIYPHRRQDSNSCGDPKL